VTDQTPNDTDAPGPEPLADEPIPDAPPAPEGAQGPARGSEWMAQLEAMIQQISTQAAPVARQVGAKAAELAALAAVKAGPAAQRAAVFTTDYGQRFAEKAQSVAAELRSQDTADGAAQETAEHETAATAAPEAAPDGTVEPGAAPAATADAAPDTRPTMSVKPIVLLGDPRLRLKGETVDSFGKYLHELLDDLTDSMRHAPGVGLAAPQLGEAVRACVVEVEGNLYELVNPEIVRTSGDDRDLEGCLSIPGYVAYITRREKVWVVARNRVGKKIKVAGSGLLGRALQHELDHLEGKLYIDYLESMDELIPVGQENDEDAEVREATSALA
jgi:peptide deformylase